MIQWHCPHSAESAARFGGGSGPPSPPVSGKALALHCLPGRPDTGLIQVGLPLQNARLLCCVVLCCALSSACNAQWAGDRATQNAALLRWCNGEKRKGEEKGGRGEG